MKFMFVKAFAAAAFVCVASGTANAATVVKPCASTDISFGASSGASYQACTGFYAGNLLNNSSNAALATELAALSFSGFTSYSAIDSANKLTTGGATVINFTNPLYGQTWIGIHYGAGNGSPGRNAFPTNPRHTDTTAFYRFDAGTAGLTSITLNYQASSGLTVFGTGNPITPVPEPATWAMMILGFGLVGGALRSRRRVSLAYA